MPKFEGLYRVLEVQNNSLTIWKRGRRVTVNIEQVQMYHPRHSNTNSFDSINETLYEGKGSSNWSNRSNSEESRRSRKPSGNESKSCKSNKGTAALEDLRFKRTRPVVLTGTAERAQETWKTDSKGHSAAEGRPVRSRKTTTVLPCPYYLRSHFKEPEGLSEEQRSTRIDSLPQNSLRRRKPQHGSLRRRSDR
ncbi:uncharacterized protein TNCV_2395991 [Trichonephila clavipes]|uniref:Uncharacterized protein n=1 Tax=Trichonephila clavipes TaxID=2585209 RepID=A0A8X6SV55_TRICX|nr:uncharacterized protein TNCV_2395991 [Trichonephila clavipes]